MECACVFVDTGDYSDLKFHRAEKRKARKMHRCSECGRIILWNEQYEYVSGKWDNFINTYKTCTDCLSIRDTFFCDGWNYSMILEDLWEYLQEIYGEVPASCILPLTENAKNRVFEMIDRIWEE